jgi:nucleoside-diphosphate-sugar epimerase
MRILVTGGTGFVGRCVSSSLLARGHEVFICNRSAALIPGCRTIAMDLLRDGTADALIGVIKPEVILHLAWYVEHGKFWSAPKNVDWTIATLRLISAARQAGVRRIVCVGTCMEYDSSSASVCSEATTEIKPATLYAISKDGTRRVAEEFSTASGMEFAWGRLFFLFGPREVPTRLVSSISLNLLSGRPAPISSGRQVRDFIDVRDAGEALAALAISNVSGAVNIGSGIPLQIADLAEKIRLAAGGGDLRFNAFPDRPNEPACLVANISRLRDEVGYRPQRTLEESILETVDWWRYQLPV